MRISNVNIQSPDTWNDFEQFVFDIRQKYGYNMAEFGKATLALVAVHQAMENMDMFSSEAVQAARDWAKGEEREG